MWFVIDSGVIAVYTANNILHGNDMRKRWFRGRGRGRGIGHFYIIYIIYKNDKFSNGFVIYFFDNYI